MQETTIIGYKQSPFGLIPTDWVISKISELLESGILIGHLDGNHGELYPKNNEFTNDGIPYISANNFFHGKMDYTNCKYLPLERAKKFKKGIAINGDVLFAHNATVGPVALLDTNLEFVILSTTATYFRCDNSKLSNLYLKSFLSSEFFRTQYEKVMGQSTRNQVPITTQRNLFTILPPLPEQQKIAAILSTWDAAIDNCKAIVEKLQQRNKGLAQQLLTGDFGQKKLSEIFERVTSKNTEGNQNVITISAQRGFVKQTDFFNKVIASDILDNYFLVKKGDFCYNKSYSNGYDWGAIKRLNDFDKAVVTTLYICFRIKDVTVISGDFFEYYFESGILNKGLSKVANEGGRAHGLLNVTPTDFFSIKIGIPTFEEQERIAKILSNATTQLNQYQQQLQILQQQKKGLMQQLLTGKVRVKI